MEDKENNIMAQVLSNYRPTEIKGAEKKVYDMFQNDKKTDDWIVIHDLRIAAHRYKKSGEVDFLVLAPNVGIFALEVKGGEIYRNANNKWCRRGGAGEKEITDPFAQAEQGISAVLDEIKKRSSYDCLLFGYGVIFPDCSFIAKDIEKLQWQIFNKDSHNIAGFVKRLAENTLRISGKDNVFPKRPNAEQVYKIAEILRPFFYFKESLATKIDKAEEMHIKLTEDQKDHLDQIEANPRCLIEGAAGTGKTFIAIDAARRFSDRGEKVALFCYNTLLAEYLKEKSIDTESKIYARKFHDFGEELFRKTNIRPTYRDKDGVEKDYLDEITKLSEEQTKSEFPSLIRPYPPELFGDHDFWEKTIPEKMLEALDKSPHEIDISFDILIVDEAQDLIINGYLQVFDKILKGGLKNGRCYFFGDFTGQMITHNPNSIEEMEELLRKYTTFYTSYPLNVNCRKIGRAHV
jgi:hypothetical protein